MIVNPIKRRPTRKIRVGSVYVGARYCSFFSQLLLI